MYANDSFWTLSPAASAGLLGLSTALALTLLAVVRRVSKTAPIYGRAPIALGVWWLFLWLSPQLYYAYYWTVIPGLPVQNVIRQPPGPLSLFELLSFRGPATLAAHSQGVLGWACVAVAVLRRSREGTSTEPEPRA
ncbi:MAG: hypothetical protein AAFP17_09840 [Pseudomonadota bacterium]